MSWDVRLRDGTLLADIEGIAMDKSIKRRLNRPASCSFRVPSYMVNEIQADGRPLLCAGYRQLSVNLSGIGLFFHGLVWTIEEDGDEDMIYSQVTCYDPMMLWRFRPARDLIDSYSGDAGNLSDPSFLDRNKFGGPIMQEILYASENYAIAPGEAEGQLFIDLAASTFTGGGSDLSGAPTNWPMTLAEIATLLTNTGELDIVLTPILGGVGSTVFDPTDHPQVAVQTVLAAQNNFQNMATMATYTGNYGFNRTGVSQTIKGVTYSPVSDVHFDYATGDYNARLFRRSEDMSSVITKNFYYLGPRLDQQHWRSNVTGDHPDLPRPSGGDVNPTTPIDPPFVPGYTGGDAPGDPDNLLGEKIEDGREQLGIFMQTSIYDNFGSGSGGTESSVYPLFLRQWQVESLLRGKPREMVYITPVRDGEFGPGDFDIGDLITINIGAKTRLAESGAQRIYAYTLEIDDDGVLALGEFEASPDQDSI